MVLNYNIWILTVIFQTKMTICMWNRNETQIMVPFTSQHDIAVKLKSWCLSPANAIWNCSQTEIMVSFTSQHINMTLLSNWNHGVFRQSMQHDMAVKLKSWCLSPANTIWHCSKTEIMVSFTSQHIMTLQSDGNHGVFHQSMQHGMAVRLKAFETVAMGGVAQSSTWNPLLNHCQGLGWAEQLLYFPGEGAGHNMNFHWENNFD